MTPSTDSIELGQSERFTLKRRLGAGSMGVVYAAHDRERREDVALKLLHSHDASTLYRFKKEFRTLADFAHPNLVDLYELIAEGGQWLFTMEIVDGPSFLDFVRPGEGDHSGALDVARLREASRQLATGVQALHDAGKLHRDLKPSNVLLTRRGRLVILDFGLATELAPERQTIDDALPGTVAYMAPEQARSEGMTAASDWYAVGVILFEALTGRLPFTGSLYDVLIGKQEQEAPSPAELEADLPADLVELCESLLAIDPQRRPSGAEVLEVLGTDPLEGVSGPVPIVAETPLVGRETQLASMEAAYLASREGRATSVYVHGSSGMGKTTLIEFFLGSLADDSRAVVLRGRCHDRETVPFEALDGVVDSLRKYLTSLPASELADLRPDDTMALARLFPVLEIFERAGISHRRESPDPLTLRRRAFTALRQLLERIAKRHPLVLFIDDLHWADADSTLLLEDLMRPPDPPPLLLLASFRSEEIERKIFLQDLLAQTDSETRLRVVVGALSDAEVRELATSILVAEDPPESVLRAIIAETDGSPFLVEQLARFIQLNSGAPKTGITLVEMLAEHIRQLPAGSRSMLLALAVANRPLDIAVAGDAARVDSDGRAISSRLRTAHLVRPSGAAHRIELYHNRIREALMTLLEAAEIRRIHGSLATAVQRWSPDNPAALFEHYLGAGDRERAGNQAILAADKAFGALAFDPAARFYRHALELARLEEDRRRELTAALARSLANAGRTAEAATVYLELAESEADDALEARCRAAEQYLLGNHAQQGLSVARLVLQEVGLEMPGGRRRALFSLVLNRLRIRVRGLGFEERTVEEIPPQDLVRIDVCWAMAIGLSMVDNLLGSDFQTRHLRLALEAGEPYRVARALAMEGSYIASWGSHKRGLEIQEHAMALARRVDNPHAIGLATAQVGLVGYFDGHWRQAIENLEEAERTFGDRCSGVAWELTLCRRFVLASLVHLGEVRELSRRVPRYLAEAKERGFIDLADIIRSRFNTGWLAADDPGTALREVDEVQPQQLSGRFTVNQYNEVFGRTQIDLYRGDGPAAHRRQEAHWRAIEGSMILKVSIIRVEALQTRARAALAAAASGSEIQPTLKIVAKAVRRIQAVKKPWSEPHAALLRASIAAFRGERDECQRLLGAAAEGFDAVDQALHAAAARQRLAEVLGGDRGRRIARAVSAWMRGQEIVKPESMIAMVAPGFPALLPALPGNPPLEETP